MEKKKEISRFGIKLMILIFPIFLFYSVSFSILFLAGELVSVSEIVNKNQDKEKGFLLGLGYSNPVKNYKLQSSIKRSPKVLVLGTSRVMQFRSDMYKEGVFYNAGGGVSRMEHFIQFLNLIPIGKEPEILIIGLDHYFFNDNWRNSPQSKMEEVEGYESSVNWFDPYIHTKVYADLLHDKFSIAGLYQGWVDRENTKGINAIINNNGFRSDGSYYYGGFDPFDSKNEDYKFHDTYERIRKGEKRFEYGTEISKSSIKELTEFLVECQKREIYVIGILPPYAHEVWEKINSDENKYRYLRKIFPEVSDIFKQYKFNVYDYSDIKSLGASDLETIDGFHGSEKTYLRIAVNLFRQEKKLAFYGKDISELKNKLLSKDHIYVF